MASFRIVGHPEVIRAAALSASNTQRGFGPESKSLGSSSERKRPVFNGGLRGSPSWTTPALYDIDAKATDSNARRDQLRLMLQALLRDRFRLVVRRETKELPIYELVTGKGGPKLKEPREGSSSGIWTEQPGEFHGGKASTAAIATFLSEVMDRYVVDRTGIEGVFDFTLTWPPPYDRGSFSRRKRAFHFHGYSGAAWAQARISEGPCRDPNHRSRGAALRELSRGTFRAAGTK